MEITPPTELQQYAEPQIAEGEYPSVAEMGNSLLPNDQEQEEMYEDTEWTVAEINQMMDESNARFERGEYITVPRENLKDFFDDIIARGEQRFKALEANK